MIKRIAFDYGRTLFDREANDFFPEVKPVLLELSKNFDLSIVSYSKFDDVENRVHALKSYGIWDLFEGVRFVQEPELKDSALDDLLDEYHLEPMQLAVVDDYIIRGIAWANRKGAVSIWFRNGKFSSCLPNSDTGQPNFEITTFGDLTQCLLA